MSITLEAIKAEHTRLAEMIATFEVAAQAREPRRLHVPECYIALAADEHYAGIVVGKDGERSYHLVLLPGEAESVDWEGAKQFAAQAGGELPTRREQALLYANLKEQFQTKWYWSGEQRAALADYAWFQDFYGGSQGLSVKGSQLRARAVRRLEI